MTQASGNAKCFGDPVTGRRMKTAFLQTHRELDFAGQNTQRWPTSQPDVATIAAAQLRIQFDASAPKRRKHQ